MTNSVSDIRTHYYHPIWSELIEELDKERAVTQLKLQEKGPISFRVSLCFVKLLLLCESDDDLDKKDDKGNYVSLFRSIAKAVVKSPDESRCKLSLVHIAAITGKKKHLSFLVNDLKMDIDTRDYKKWTALHHIALLNDMAMMSHLKEHQADTKALNGFGGTYSDITQITTHPSKIKRTGEIENVFWNSHCTTDEPVIEPLTHESFKTVTGKTFIESPYISPDDYFEFWRSSDVVGKTDLKNQALESFELSKAKRIIYPLSDKQGKEFGLMLDSDIGPGEIIDVYSGRMSPSREGLSSPYAMALCSGDKLLAFVDAQNLCSTSAFANDGFPNVIIEVVPNYKGLPAFTVVVAVTTIKSMEPIVYNYGKAHDVKFGPYRSDLCSITTFCRWPHLSVTQEKTRQEENEKELIETKNQSLSSSSSKGKVLASDEEIEAVLKRSRVRYILETPAAFYAQIMDPQSNFPNEHNLSISSEKGEEYEKYLYKYSTAIREEVASLLKKYPKLDVLIVVFQQKAFEIYAPKVAVRVIYEWILSFAKHQDLEKLNSSLELRGNYTENRVEILGKMNKSLFK